jgi:phosphate transport system substrate-binding protein
LNLKKSRLAWLLAILAVFTLFAAACSDDDSDDGETTDSSDGGSDDGGSASGEVFVTGSSTVEPVSVAVAEAFADENPDIDVTVEGPGTGDGFAAFCNGEADISDASRPIKGEEADICAENGIEFIELKVAIDGLAVITNPANDAVTCLTFADLYALVGPESEGFDNWADAQELATELSSDTELPDAPLAVTAPGEESGTYDSFVEIVLESAAEPRVEEGVITEDDIQARADYTSSADDNVIIQGIEGSDTSFGWVGLAFASEAGDEVKVVEIDGGDGCVAPDDETVSSGEYPIARDLYIYVNTASLADNPAVQPYVDYYVEEGLTFAPAEVGYVQLADEDITATQEVWASEETGTRDGGE